MPFTSEYTQECLDKIQALGAVTYQLSRGGLNPFTRIFILLYNTLKIYYEKFNLILYFHILLNLHDL